MIRNLCLALALAFGFVTAAQAVEPTEDAKPSQTQKPVGHHGRGGRHTAKGTQGARKAGGEQETAKGTQGARKAGGEQETAKGPIRGAKPVKKAHAKPRHGGAKGSAGE